MIPFYFGSRERKLFGVFEPAQNGGAKRAVLLCYPWGYEYVNSHRSMARLGTLLSHTGFHTLRFYYYGTGDSGGEDREADIEGSRRDIVTAIEELIELSGVERVSIVGLRLGAMLGVAAACEKPHLVDRIVLWDPVVEGGQYLQELYNLDDSISIPGVGPASYFSEELGGGREVMGLPMTHSVAAGISDLDLTSRLAQLPHATYAVATRSSHLQRQLQALLEQRADGSAFERLDDHPAWHEEWPENAGAIPVAVLNRIVSWLK